MLHPLLVDHLINKYLGRSHCEILDPFCGSGVTLLQGIMQKHNVVGFDINPLAMLITKVKTSTYNEKTLMTELCDLRNSIVRSGSVDIPPIRNIDTWYDPNVVSDLGRIRHILNTKEYLYREFFVTCLAFVCRNQSFTRNGEFKRYRLPAAKRAKAKNMVIPVYLAHTKSMIDIFTQQTIPRPTVTLKLRDIESNFPNDIEVDMVLTSPPYGDSSTTVAYEQYTSFGFEWTNDLVPEFRADPRYHQASLGNKNVSFVGASKHRSLMETIDRITEVDEKRASEVMKFFASYYRTLCNISKSLRPSGYICLVVGNRTVKNNQIPMDQITAAFLSELGMTFESISIREISNKVMPSRNSPSNLSGRTSQTMSAEYIVVFKKST